MIDWREVDIISYLELEEEKTVAEEKMANNQAIANLKKEIDIIKSEINIREFGYRAHIQNCESAMQSIKEKVIKEWDLEDKSFKCDAGAATVKTTRSLKVDNKEMLINILQKIGKLTQCIKGWDLPYLRKLVDAGMFDVEEGRMNVVHYDQKGNVIISAAKKESGGDGE